MHLVDLEPLGLALLLFAQNLEVAVDLLRRAHDPGAVEDEGRDDLVAAELIAGDLALILGEGLL